MSVMPENNWFHVEEILANKVSTSYTGKFPAYFDASNYSWTALLPENYEQILKEFELFNEQHHLQPYFYKAQAKNTGKWKTLPLITWNITRKNLKHFPNTKQILDKIPGLVSASFSMLEAGGEIVKHRGDTDAHIRTHLCLYTATDNTKIAFNVNNISKNWETGKCLLFCDAHVHGGYNHSNEDRLVMIIDVLHEENIQHKNKVCSKVLSGLLINYLLVLFGFKKLNAVLRLFFKIFYNVFQLLFRCLMKLNIKL
ncbi:MAG: aspartyl/asparaginyl beta-hydroxylase domain-containing protein [Chitinophagales bacterium]